MSPNFLYRTEQNNALRNFRKLCGKYLSYMFFMWISPQFVFYSDIRQILFRINIQIFFRASIFPSNSKIFLWEKKISTRSLNLILRNKLSLTDFVIDFLLSQWLSSLWWHLKIKRSFYFSWVHFQYILAILTLICLKWIPENPSAIFLAYQCYAKNVRNLRFHVFLHFKARKQVISSFFLKWTEFTRNCELFTI